MPAEGTIDGVFVNERKCLGEERTATTSRLGDKRAGEPPQVRVYFENGHP